MTGLYVDVSGGSGGQRDSGGKGVRGGQKLDWLLDGSRAVRRMARMIHPRQWHLEFELPSAARIRDWSRVNLGTIEKAEKVENAVRVCNCANFNVVGERIRPAGESTLTCDSPSRTCITNLQKQGDLSSAVGSVVTRAAKNTARTGRPSLNAAFCRLVFLELPSDQMDMAEACGVEIRVILKSAKFVRRCGFPHLSNHYPNITLARRACDIRRVQCACRSGLSIGRARCRARYRDLSFRCESL
jgi:hypothetical protein